MTAKLEELDALVKEATPGPWSARIGGNYADDVWVASDAERPWESRMALRLWSRTMGRGDYAIGSPEHKTACANAALIVWLVNNAPAMLRAQAEEIARLRERLGHLLSIDSQHDRTPRIIDLAYHAFMRANETNAEDGGATDWMTDTRPLIVEAIKAERHRAALTVPPDA